MTIAWPYYTKTPFFGSRLKSRRFWVKEPRHPENIFSAEVISYLYITGVVSLTVETIVGVATRGASLRHLRPVLQHAETLACGRNGSGRVRERAVNNS